MSVFTRILWPVDFSPTQELVLPYVLELAAQEGATLHLLHVVMDLGQCGGIFDLGPLQDGLLAQAQAKMDKLGQGLSPRTPGLKTLVTCGDPVEKALDYVRDNGIDLIVLGTHGRKGLEHAVLGSVAENLLRRSPVPVLTVNPHRLGQGGQTG